MQRLFWWLNALFAALFVFAAVLQYNDPESLRWIAMYLAAAVPCVLVLVRRLAWPWPALVAAIALGWAAVYAARGAWTVPFGEMLAEWEMKNQQVLETREMFGLSIVAGWMLVVTTVALVRRRRANAG